MPLFVYATRYESLSSVSVLCLNCVDQLSRDDEQVQAAPHIHQKCCHQELLREVHQLHSGLHLYLQTGMDRRCCKLYIFCPWNLQRQVFLNLCRPKKSFLVFPDGLATRVLRNHTGGFERCQKWQTVVQNEHKGTLRFLTDPGCLVSWSLSTTRP